MATSGIDLVSTAVNETLKYQQNLFCTYVTTVRTVKRGTLCPSTLIIDCWILSLSMTIYPPHHPALEMCIETGTSHVPHNSLRSHRNKVYCFKRANFDLLRALLSWIDWASLLSNLPINDGASAFYTELWRCIQQCVPMYSPKRTLHSGWETTHLRKLKNLKNRLFKKYKRTGSLMSYTVCRGKISLFQM